MRFYKTKSSNTLFKKLAAVAPPQKQWQILKNQSFKLTRGTSSLRKSFTQPFNYIFFFVYASLIGYIVSHGITQSTSVVPIINSTPLVYQFKNLRQLRKQKRTFQNNKWANYRFQKDLKTSTKNKYSIIPSQNSQLENFFRYFCSIPKKATAAQLVTLVGRERFFGNQLLSITYPPLHPRILRIYLKDKATVLQTDKQALNLGARSWQTKFIDKLFIETAIGRFAFLSIINLWALACFCIFIKQSAEGFFFTLIDDGDTNPIYDDPIKDFILPSNLILPEHNTKNFLSGIPTGVATNELKPLIEALSAASHKPFSKMLNKSSKMPTIPTGILFLGGFETGGSNFAQALAGEAKVPFIRIPATQFVLSNIHEGLLLMRVVFHFAKSMAPAILHIDDIEVFGGLRSSVDLASSVKKDSLFYAKYEKLKSDYSINPSPQSKKENFNQAFQSFKKHSDKPFKAFISNSLRICFRELTEDPTVSSNFPSTKQNLSNNSNQNLSDDDLTSLLNQLLIELDGIAPTSSSLITTATAKEISKIEPALLRPGRLSKHIELDSLYTLDREKLIQALLFKHKCTSSIPWYLFAAQLKNFDYLPLKQIVENAIYYSKIFSKTKTTIEFASLLFAKNRYFLSQDLLLDGLGKESIHEEKQKFIQNTIASFVKKRVETDFNEVSSFEATLSIIPALLQPKQNVNVKTPQTLIQVLNQPQNIFLANILEDLWSQQQNFNVSSQYILFLFSLSSLLVDIDGTRSDIQSVRYTEVLTRFKNIETRSLVPQFTTGKKLNLIDVFGNMQFINQWRQSSLLTKKELAQVSNSILSSRYLIIEYHAYLSFALCSHLNQVSK